MSESIEITLEQIKTIIKQMAELNFLNKKALTTEEKIIGAEIGKISFDLFVQFKEETKTFTVCDDPVLKRYQTSDDDDDFKSIKIMEILNDNSDAFHELIANKYIGKKRGSVAKTENQLYFWRLYSQYSYNYEEVFFVFRKGDFYLMLDKVTNVKFEDFLQKYFGNLSDDQIREYNDLKADINLSHDEMQHKITTLCKNLNESMSIGVKFQKGAISFFDFLGWKGLWLNKEDTPLKQVSELIDNIRLEFEKITREVMGHPNGFELSHLISISDTIALFTPQIPNIEKKDLLAVHAKIGQFILRETVRYNYAIRGAVSYGEYSFKNNIMIGPGIDECASWHEQCNWIGAHFTPKAQFILDREGYDKDYIIEYQNIPIKNGLPRPKYCVLWSVDENQFDDLLNSVQSMIPEISSKYIFTKDFLDKK